MIARMHTYFHFLSRLALYLKKSPIVILISLFVTHNISSIIPLFVGNFMSFSIAEMMFWNVFSERSPSVDAIRCFNRLILSYIILHADILHHSMFMIIG